jgi:hypothetical protein
MTPDEMKRKAWKYLRSQGLTEEGTAGLMGNLERESDGFYPNRVERLCLKRLKEIGKIYTDATYTAFVDDGTITFAEFLHPLPNKQYGYGLAQWTTPARKSGLYDKCKKKGVSIADLQTQLEYLMYELETSYASLLKVLKTTNDIANASTLVLTKFEQPANTDYAVRQVRYQASKKIYDEFADKGGDDMSIEQAIQKAINIAKQEIGYLEKKSNADLDSKTGNAGPPNNNFTKYWRDVYPQYQQQPWCAVFISWVLMVAFGLEAAKKLLQHWPYVYCPTLANKTSNRTPSVGSIILFYRNGAYAHTGLVIAVTDTTVTTIEGNTSGAALVVPNGNGVCQKSYSISSLSNMTKYFVPDYSIVAEKEKYMYYVRSSWLDIGSQKYQGNDLDKAKEVSKKNKQLYVFDKNGKVLYPVHSSVKAKIERAVQWANAVQADPRHGYDNTDSGRWGQKGDFACSSLIITAYQLAGVPVKDKGATVTANMREAFLKAGFADVTKHVNFTTCAGLVRGDVLINPGKHTELYIGTKRLIGARGNAYGPGPEHGKPGDQGGEIVKTAYYNFPWTICLRFEGLPKNKRVQAGSFEKKANAEALEKEIKARTGLPMTTTRIDGWYTVRTKSMDVDEAEEAFRKLKSAGFDAIIV